MIGPYNNTLFVATQAAIANLHVAPLNDGTIAYVIADGTRWLLNKASGAAPGPTVIQPNAGSPIAGGATARWLQLTSGGGSSVLIETAFVAQATDVIATTAAPLFIPSVSFTVVGAGVSAIVWGSISGSFVLGVANRGTCRWGLMLDGVFPPFLGTIIEEPSNIDGDPPRFSGAMSTKIALAAGLHTVNMYVGPLPPMTSANIQPVTGFDGSGVWDHATILIELVNN